MKQRVATTVFGVVAALSLFGCTSFASLPRPTFFSTGPLASTPDLPLPEQPECAGSWEGLSLVRDGMPNREWYVCRTNDGHRPPPFEAIR